MSPHLNIPDELKELNSSLPLPARMPGYEVPAGYFDELADKVLAGIRTSHLQTAEEELAGLSPLLSGISRKTPYAAPPGYFDELEISFTDEKTELADWMQGLQNRATYQVPAGYFEQLPEILLRKAKAQQPAKVISMGRKVFRYAAAAVITGVIALGSILLLNKPSGNTGALTAKWVASNAQEVNSLLELAKADSAATVKTSAAADISLLVKDIPEKEIQDFLNDADLTDTGSEELQLN